MFILPTKWNFIAKSFEALSSILDRVYNDIYTEVLDIRTITWVAVTFANNWVNYNTTYNAAAYCKDGMGFVHLRGLVKDGTVDLAIFTLPVGYRPFNRELFTTQCNSTIARIDITSLGVVCLVSSTNPGNTWISLDGITFYAG